MSYTFPIKAPYRITQKFGENKLDYSGFGLKGHNGIDIAVPRGTPIITPHVGVITHLADTVPAGGKDSNGYGNYIRLRIEDNDKIYQWVFGHILPYTKLKVNQLVSQDEVLAFVDSTGFSTGDHLHIGIRELDDNYNVKNYNNGYLGYIDPMPFFKKVPDEIYPVDLRYYQPENKLREYKWKIIHESYAKKRAKELTLPWSDRFMKAFVYGYYPVEIVFNVAMVEVWRNMHYPEYIKRVGG